MIIIELVQIRRLIRRGLKKLTVNENLEYNEASIVAVGDILIHEEQLKAQFNEGTGEYNFENNFKYVKSHIKSADIALANFETTIAGEKQKYTGFPLFNSPSSIVDAMKNCGFDILSTINNHTIDRGSAGVLSTLEEIKKRDLKASWHKGKFTKTALHNKTSERHKNRSYKL